MVLLFLLLWILGVFARWIGVSVDVLMLEARWKLTLRI
jgi:hypothetical protein